MSTWWLLVNGLTKLIATRAQYADNFGTSPLSSTNTFQYANTLLGVTGPRADIIHSPDFESGCIRELRGKTARLTRAEKAALRAFSVGTSQAPNRWRRMVFRGAPTEAAKSSRARATIFSALLCSSHVEHGGEVLQHGTSYARL
jgi:hypothetical protein